MNIKFSFRYYWGYKKYNLWWYNKFNINEELYNRIEDFDIDRVINNLNIDEAVESLINEKEPDYDNYDDYDVEYDINKMVLYV